MIEIPLNTSPSQEFRIAIDGVNYDCEVTLNSRTSTWTISISRGGVALVSGARLLSGVDILKQYNIELRNLFAVNLVNSKLDPDKDSLGEGSKLLMLTDEEVNNGSTV